VGVGATVDTAGIGNISWDVDGKGVSDGDRD